MNIPPELKKVFEDTKAGKHQWTQFEKDLYAKVVERLGPEKARQLMAMIPPPSN